MSVGYTNVSLLSGGSLVLQNYVFNADSLEWETEEDVEDASIQTMESSVLVTDGLNALVTIFLRNVDSCTFTVAADDTTAGENFSIDGNKITFNNAGEYTVAVQGVHGDEQETDDIHVFVVDEPGEYVFDYIIPDSNGQIIGTSAVSVTFTE